jgi:glycine cleavage system aminomethyltransferase T
LPTPTSSVLNFGPWYRRSPFFDATLRAGCSAYDVYQHMLHPNTYGDPVEEYWSLVNDVTLWDVAVERIVEIVGPDASAFTNLLTCRDLTRCEVGQGKYTLVTAADGGIVNDPVLRRIGGGSRSPTPTPTSTRWASRCTRGWTCTSAIPTSTPSRCRPPSRRT